MAATTSGVISGDVEGTGWLVCGYPNEECDQLARRGGSVRGPHTSCYVFPSVPVATLVGLELVSIVAVNNGDGFVDELEDIPDTRARTVGSEDDRVTRR